MGYCQNMQETLFAILAEVFHEIAFLSLDSETHGPMAALFILQVVICEGGLDMRTWVMFMFRYTPLPGSEIASEKHN